MPNIFEAISYPADEELFTSLLARPGLHIERIVSSGQSTPHDVPYQQDHEEWVLLLKGAARLRIEDGPEQTLTPGDFLLIPASQRHWVTWTDPSQPTIWLALHLKPDADLPSHDS